MAAKVAGPARAYSDVPPPKNDSLADLEAQLEALRSPDYRSPFQFKPSSLKPPGVGPYESLGAYASVAEALKPPAINVPSPYQAHHTTGLVLPGPTPLSELLTERHGQSPGPIGAAKFLYEAGETLNRTMEAWRPQIERLGAFIQNIQRTLEALRLRPPFMYAALDAWEAFQEGDLEALDRFIVNHLDRRPDDRTRLAVQSRLARAFGSEAPSVPEWASGPRGFDVAVFRRIQREARAEEKAITDKIERLRAEGVDRVKVGSESGLRLRKALSQELGLDHRALWIDKKLEAHYVCNRFPGAVLVAGDEKPNLPEMPSRKREPNLRSYTATVVAREAGEGLIKQKVIARPLKTNKYDDLVVPFDPKEDRRNPPSVITPLSEDSHVEQFEAQERERGRLNQLHEAVHRAGLSSREEEVMRLKWFEGLGNKDIAARLGRSASQVGVEAHRGLQKVTAAARG